MSDKIQKYFRFIKFSHTIFAMPFAMIGFFLAISRDENSFSWLVFIFISMIFARSAAMGFNRYLDRNIDAKNPRTAQREIPQGKISEKSALVFVVVMSVLFIATTFLINKLVFYLSFVALAVVLGYSYTKRFTPLSHIVLGIGLALAPIGAYLSVTSKFDLIPLLYSLLVLFWVSGFDIIYALQDYDFDKQNNLRSIPVLVGKKKAMTISVFLHLITAAISVTIGLLGSYGIFYWVGAIIFNALLFYQHTIVKYDDLSRVNLAFGTTNGIASVVFATFVIIDILF